MPVRVHVVDPSAYTPPYDDALCAALARAGAEVELFTSRFTYGAWPAPRGYVRRELFYRRGHGGAGEQAGAGAGARGPRSRARRTVKLAEHVPGMLRYRAAARAADIVHFQWLAVPQLDVHLLPRGRPRVLTAHDVLPREPTPGQLRAVRRLYEQMDAIVVHSEHGHRRLTGEVDIPAEHVHVVPHGALRLGSGAGDAGAKSAGLPRELDGGASALPVVLLLGLLRPYKGIDVLLEAWRGISGAELWIVGMPRMDTAPLRRAAPGSVRFLERFTTGDEADALLRRADLVVLPYLAADQSGVLFAALGAGRPLLLSDVGGFPEVASTGAARVVPSGDVSALRQALRELIGDGEARAAMAAAALRAAAGRYSWERSAELTLELYERLLGENQAR